MDGFWNLFIKGNLFNYINSIMELENNNNDFLALPQKLKLNEYNPDLN